MTGLSFVSDFKVSPDETKPREKLQKFGPTSLALWELIAIVLRTGEKHKGGYFEDVSQLSHRLLSDVGFKGLFTQTDPEHMRENFNLYKSHSEIIVTISEICRRIHGQYDTFDASVPQKIYEKFKDLQTKKQEQCHVLHIDSKNRCIFQEMVALGGGDQVQVFPTDVLRSAIWLGAKKIIIVHNHLGSPHPSEEDVAWTLSLKKGAQELHQINIADHVIIGKNAYFSFLEKGII